MSKNHLQRTLLTLGFSEPTAEQSTGSPAKCPVSNKNVPEVSEPKALLKGAKHSRANTACPRELNRAPSWGSRPSEFCRVWQKEQDTKGQSYPPAKQVISYILPRSQEVKPELKMQIKKIIGFCLKKQNRW